MLMHFNKIMLEFRLMMLIVNLVFCTMEQRVFIMIVWIKYMWNIKYPFYEDPVLSVFIHFRYHQFPLQAVSVKFSNGNNSSYQWFEQCSVGEQHGLIEWEESLYCTGKFNVLQKTNVQWMEYGKTSYMISKLKFCAEMKVSIVKAYQSGCLCHNLDGQWLGFDSSGCDTYLASYPASTECYVCWVPWIWLFLFLNISS